MSSYVGYRVANTGAAARDGLWTRLESFTGGVVGPAAGGSVAETLPLPALGPSASTPVYSYLTATGETTSAQQHDLVVYDGRPGAGGAELCRETETIARVSDVIKAAANKVTSASVSTSDVSLGGEFTMTVTGDAGTIGSGPATDPGAMRFSPAVAADWPSTSFRLVGVSSQVPLAGSPLADVLGRSNMSGSPLYSVTYRFRAVGPTSGPTPLLPVQNIASGTQVKHTDPGTLTSLPPIPAVSSTTTMAAAGGGGTYVPGDTAPVTVTVHQAGSGPVEVDDIHVLLPAGWSYASGTAQRDGAALDDPYVAGAGDLRFVGPFTIPGDGDARFTFDVVAGSSAVSGDVTAVGTLAGGQIDATLDPADDQPARAALTVAGPPIAHDDAFEAVAGIATDLPVLDNDDAAGGTPAVAITGAPAHGTAVVDGGSVRYTADSGYSGADSLAYRVTTAAGASDAVVTLTVIPPPPPPPPVASTGAGTAPQTLTLDRPTGGSVTLLDGNGDPATAVTVPEGVYTLDPDSGLVTFVPALGFTGTPTPVTYRVDDAGWSGQATYTPSVTAPPPPAAEDDRSTGIGPATQGATVAVPAGGTVTLLDRDGGAATAVDVPGEGRYVLDPVSGAIAFVPAAGFAGAGSGVAVVVTDAYGQSTNGRYTPTVTAPAPPAARDLGSHGPAATPQGTVIAIPAGCTAGIVAADGSLVERLTVPGEGVYVLDAATGVLTFTPEAGFTRSAAGVTYAIVDLYGQRAAASYVPVVDAAPAGAPRPGVPAPSSSDLPHTGVPAPAAPTPSARAAAPAGPTALRFAGARSRGARQVVARRGRVTVVIGGRLHVAGARITVTAGVAGREVVVGHARARGRARVSVRLDRLGRALVRRVGGVRLRAAAAVLPAAGGAPRSARAAARAVAPWVVVPRPVFFDSASARIRPAAKRHLRALRRRLVGVRLVACTGFTDDRSSGAYNRALGRARAHSVCSLLRRGPAVGAALASRGEWSPQASNATARGRQLNRRTEIRLRY